MNKEGKKNVIFLYVDSLSKKHIDLLKEEGDFFSFIEKNSFSYENVYSSGPFTQAGYKSLIVGENIFNEGYGYLAPTNFGGKQIFDLFRENGYYVYRSIKLPFEYDTLKYDNKEIDSLRITPSDEGFEEIWRYRMLYYISIYNDGKFKPSDEWKMIAILDDFFAHYTDKKCEKERCLYQQDKLKYIYDILQRNKNSSLGKAALNEYTDAFLYSETEKMKSFLEEKASKDECMLAVRVKYKNYELFLKNNEDLDWEKVYKEIYEKSNYSLEMNSYIETNLRKSYKLFPKMSEDVDTFIDWLNHYNYEQPFFAFISNFDYHYPLNFINNIESNTLEYNKELNEKLNWLDDISCTKLSVASQLSYRNIEKELFRLFNELTKRDMWDDTILIITSDHGLHNDMKIKPEYWDYTKDYFQTPFYIFDGKTKGVDWKFKSQVEMHDMVLKMFNIPSDKINLPSWEAKYKTDDMTFTYWINGVPDLDRVPIKIGVRNLQYSITYVNYLGSLFSCGKIISVYDLITDQYEEHNLSDNQIELEGSFYEFLNTIKDIWFDLNYEMLLNRESPYQFFQSYNFLEGNSKKWRELNSNQIPMKHKDFEELCKGRVIIFGAGEEGKKLIGELPLNCEIAEIWDNHKQGEYILGHKICSPHKLNNSSSIVIVTCRYDMIFIHELENLGIENYILYRSILK